MGRVLASAIVAAVAAIAPAQLEDEAGRIDLGPLDSQNQTRRPELAQRTVAVFDFEEQHINPRDLPMNWIRAQDDREVRERPGFPLYNLAVLDYTVAGEGVGSVRLPTDGGSTSLRLSAGVIPVFPNADYRVTALVRTKGVDLSRARMTLRFLDDDANPIDDSERHTELVASNGRWVPIETELWGDFEQAAYVQIDLELLQPRQFQTNTLGDQQIWIDDIGVAAWFDNVVVTQLPRVEIRTTSDTNIVALPDSPSLELLVRDLTGEQLTADIVIRDIADRVVGTWTRSIGSGRTVSQWQPELELLGWYRAFVYIRAGDRLVGDTYVDFIWIPGDSRQVTGSRRTRTGQDKRTVLHAGSIDRERFGLAIEHLPERLQQLIPEIAARLGVGRVSLPAWQGDLEPEDALGIVERLVPTIEALIDDSRRVSLTIPRVPTPLAHSGGIDQTDIVAMLALPEQSWSPYLLPMLDRFGERVHRWVIGATGGTGTFRRADLTGDLQAATEALAALVPGPIVAIPWRPEFAWPDIPEQTETPAGALLVHWPASLSATAVAAFADVWNDRQPSTELTFSIEPARPGDYGYRWSTAQCLRHAVEFWAHFDSRLDPFTGHSTRLELVEPWTWTGARRPQLMPRPELAAWRCLIDRLADRRVVATIQTIPGVTCYVLAPTESAPDARGGAVVMWRNDDRWNAPPVEILLGQGSATMYDPFGNQTQIEPIASSVESFGQARLVHHVPVTPMPLFIENIDVEMVGFLASFRVEPTFIPARSVRHQRQIIFTNPWKSRLTGRYFIIQPGGRSTPDAPPDRTWNLIPRSAQFSLAPGETVRLPLSVAFTKALEAGPRPFVFDIELTADRDYPPLRIAVPMEIGLEHLYLDVSYRTDGDSLLIEARITNTGSENLTLEVESFAEGFPRERRSVSGLEPGQQVVRRFSYPDARAALLGNKVSVRVTDIQSAARLSKSVDIR